MWRWLDKLLDFLERLKELLQKRKNNGKTISNVSREIETTIQENCQQNT